MRRAVVDQDITPTEELLAGVPDAWETTVGLDSTVAAVAAALEGVHVAFVTSRIPLPREILAGADDLEIVAKLGTGVDNIDRRAAAERGITVTHTPGYNALSVAEHTVGLVLATSRRLTEARALLDRGGWRDEYTLATRLSGSTVGIVGVGNVGKRVGRLLTGFDVDLLGHDPYVPAIDAELVGGEMTSLGSLLDRSDVVVLATELTDETSGLIGERELSRMKRSAILVNTSRGPVVEEAALVDALETRSIAGAGLDVFTDEPLDADSPLLNLENVVATPHVSAMTYESRTESIDQLTTNVVRLVEGRDVPEQFIARPPGD